jgi:hypothetical protein
MFQQLIAVFGKHVDSPEFRAMQAEFFPDFKLGKNKDQYRDKTTKVVLVFNCLSKYDDSAPIPTDPSEYRYFTGFFFGKDESEIPFGITAKDNEATTIKKAGQPTFHNKVLKGSIFENINDLHYHFGDYKMVVGINPDTGKNWGQVGIFLKLKGMRF